MFLRLVFVLTVGLTTLGLVSTASAANCQFYVSSTVVGNTPYLTTTVALVPFAVNCNGSFGGTLQNLSSAWLTLQLEKQDSSGNFQVVASGYISYGGTPGIYRYTVKNSGNGNGDWQVSYRHP